MQPISVVGGPTSQHQLGQEEIGALLAQIWFSLGGFGLRVRMFLERRRKDGFREVEGSSWRLVKERSIIVLSVAEGTGSFQLYTSLPSTSRC